MTTVGSIYLYSFQEVNDLAGTDDWERLVFFSVTNGCNFVNHIELF